jgi:phospholipid-transporting ATPase
MALFEKDLDEDSIEKYPQVYRQVRRGLYWSWTQSWSYLLSSFWHSLVLYFGITYVIQDGVLDPSGRGIGYWIQCYFYSVPMLITVLCKAGMVTKHWVFWTWFGLIGSFCASVLVQWVVEVWQMSSEIGTMSEQHMIPAFYFSAALTVTACLAPDMIIM